MSIMSDKWIAKAATTHNMISPFVDKQVRFNENNEKIISDFKNGVYFVTVQSSEIRITNRKLVIRH